VEYLGRVERIVVVGVVVVVVVVGVVVVLFDIIHLNSH